MSLSKFSDSATQKTIKNIFFYFFLNPHELFARNRCVPLQRPTPPTRRQQRPRSHRTGTLVQVTTHDPPRVLRFPNGHLLLCRRVSRRACGPFFGSCFVQGGGWLALYAGSPKIRPRRYFRPDLLQQNFQGHSRPFQIMSKIFEFKFKFICWKCGGKNKKNELDKILLMVCYYLHFKIQIIVGWREIKNLNSCLSW